MLACERTPSNYTPPKQDTDSDGWQRGWGWRASDWKGEKEEGNRVRVGWGGNRRTGGGIGEYTGDKKDTQWREVSQHCCKSSAGPCKLSDKLRVLKA